MPPATPPSREGVSAPAGEIFGLNVEIAPTGGESIDYAEFVARVRTRPCDDLLLSLARCALYEEPPYTSEYMKFLPPWGIAAVAKQALLGTVEGPRRVRRRAGRGSRPRTVGHRDVVELCRAYNAVEGRHPVGADVSAVGISDLVDDARQAGDWEASISTLMTRLAYEQFGYQESEYDQLARSQAMLIDGLEEVETTVLTAQAWEDLLGAPLQSAVAATFLIQVGANVNEGQYTSSWLDQDNFAQVLEVYPRAHIEAIAAKLITSKTKFAAAARDVPAVPGLERYGYNPLFATPFVRLDDGRAVAPQPRLITRTITPDGLYYRGIRRWGKPFATDLGKLVEAYVGRQLRLIEGAEVHPEVVYNRGQNKSIDFFVVLDDVVILVEAKSARLGVGARAGSADLADAFTRAIGKSYEQLETTLNEMKARNPAFSHIPHDRAIVGLVVTAEPFYTANLDEVRQRLPAVSEPVMTCSLSELEGLVVRPEVEIADRLTHIAVDRSLRQRSLSTALGDRGPRNAILDRAWDALPMMREDDIKEPGT